MHKATTHSGHMEATRPSTKLTAGDIRVVAGEWAAANIGELHLEMELPEYDDRYDFWRVSFSVNGRESVGEVCIDDMLCVVRSTDVGLIRRRVKGATRREPDKRLSGKFHPHPTKNQVILGDALEVMGCLPPDTAQLVVTSPPYYNAKPEYSEYLDYQDYLEFLRLAFSKAHRILSDGRFLVVNVSPVLVRRTSRSTASKRMPIPFDVNRLLVDVGFEFIDDIIWVKPEGAGWNTGRGRRFAADRQPLQYKPVPVTEHVLVYRKQTDRLIDWNLRNHHDPSLIEASLIEGDYDVTNVWYIHPAHKRGHPAVFPDELVQRLVRYYSFKGDLVLDPFAGSGTVGRVAHGMGRRLLLIDNEPKYFRLMKRELRGLDGIRFYND